MYDYSNLMRYPHKDILLNKNPESLINTWEETDAIIKNLYIEFYQQIKVEELYS